MPTRFWQVHTGREPQLFRGVPRHLLAGACELAQDGLPVLRAQWGNVVSRIPAIAGVQGEAFLSCIDTEYYLHGWPLEAALLLDACPPGLTLGTLPGARPVPAHPGEVNLALGRFPGDISAKKLGHAWLVVQGGESRTQRLQVLAALRIQRLRTSDSHRSLYTRRLPRGSLHDGSAIAADPHYCCVLGKRSGLSRAGTPPKPGLAVSECHLSLEAVQQAGVAEADVAVEALRPVAGVRDQEDEPCAAGMGFTHRVTDDRAGQATATMARVRIDVLHLSDVAVDVKLAPCRYLAWRDYGEKASSYYRRDQLVARRKLATHVRVAAALNGRLDSAVRELLAGDLRDRDARRRRRWRCSKNHQPLMVSLIADRHQRVLQGP